MDVTYFIGIIIFLNSAVMAVDVNGNTTDVNTQPETETENGLKQWWSTHIEPLLEKYKTEIVFYTAGFLTASLIFSFVCVVSRCRRKPRKTNEEQTEKQNTLNKSEASLNIQEIGNEGSCDSDLKSYACVNMNKPNDDTDDVSASVTSTKGYKRGSYDIIDLIPENQAEVKHINLNPYSHVPAELEMTIYDMTSYIKPRSDMKDPTYSHIKNLQKETTDLSGITKTHDATTVPKCRLAEETKNPYKDKHGLIVMEKKLTSGNLIEEYKTNEDNTGDDFEKETRSQGHRDNTLHCNLRDDRDADTKIRKNKHGYSFVKKAQRSSDIVSDDTKTFGVDQDGNKAVSGSVSSEQSNEDITSMEATEEETRCLLDSDFASSQSESSSECPLNPIHEPMLAINALYEKFELENGEEIDDILDKSFEDIQMELNACLNDS